MPIRKNNIPQTKALLTRKLSAMIHEGARAGAEKYRENVTAVTDENFPTGPFYPPHSAPGEYPERDSGQGAENIDAEFPEDLIAGFGVRGERTGTERTVFNAALNGGNAFDVARTPRRAGGEHLIDLSTESRGDRRLGPQDTLTATNRSEIVQRMQQAAVTVPDN